MYVFSKSKIHIKVSTHGSFDKKTLLLPQLPTRIPVESGLRGTFTNTPRLEIDSRAPTENRNRDRWLSKSKRQPLRREGRLLFVAL